MTLPTDPTRAARLALHFASQIPAAFAAAKLPAVDDFSHTALHWEDGGLWSGYSAVGRRVGLVFESFAIVVDAGGDGVRIPLAGLTMLEALAQTAEACGLDALLQLGHDLPEAIDEDAPFVEPPAAQLAVWASWFDHAYARLGVVEERPDASPIRVWSHHFDIASLVQIDPAGAEDARSIGVGFSPGDTGFPDGYWYVNVWPAPDAATLPELVWGSWHTEGWTGAVLTVRQMGAAADARAKAFIRDAVASALRVMSPQSDDA